jgi:two-component system LytT family response regulator
MTRAIIIDDEVICQDILLSILRKMPGRVAIVGVCGTADEGKEAIKTHQPDIVFLDVEMRGKNGFDLLGELNDINFDIVFSTAFDHYAIRAIKASALDFLLKPIVFEDVQAALDRYDIKKNSQDVSTQVSIALEHFSKRNSAEPKIALRTMQGLEFIPVNQILHVEADKNYSIFHLIDKKKITASKTLKDIEEYLEDYQFLRVHQSHLINLRYVRKYQKGEGGVVIMDDGTNIVVSRQKKESFLNAINVIK